MNLSRPVLFLTAMLAFQGTGRGVDLTPHFVTRVTAARTERIPFFQEGETRYSLQPPPETTVSGNSGEALFRFGNLEGASLVLRDSPLQPSAAFDGAAQEVYRKTLPQFLPPQAEHVAIEQGEPMTVNGWNCLGFTMAYKLPGRAFMQAVIFLNYSASQQICLIVTAPAEQFSRAQALSLRMMRTWRTLLPGENPAVPPQL